MIKGVNKFVDTKWWKFKWSLRSKSGILHIRNVNGDGTALDLTGWIWTDI